MAERNSPPLPGPTPEKPSSTAKTKTSSTPKRIRRRRSEVFKLLQDQCSSFLEDTIEHVHATARLLCMSALEECKFGLKFPDTIESKTIKEKLHVMIKLLGDILLERETLINIGDEEENRNPKSRKLVDEYDRDFKKIKKDDQQRNVTVESDEAEGKNMDPSESSHSETPSTTASIYPPQATTSQDSGDLSYIDLGVGLRNELDENHCFLNVIIQSLWHLKVFLNKFMSKFERDQKHLKIGKPPAFCDSTASSGTIDSCGVCALKFIFTEMNEMLSTKNQKPIDATPLRSTLNKLQPRSDLFEEGRMSDASEALDVILKCIHTAFSSPLFLYGTNDNIEGCSSRCKDNNCLVDEIFALHMPNAQHPQLLHHANANELKKKKAEFKDNSFDKLLKLVVPTDGLFSIREDDDRVGYSSPYIPPVFTLVLGGSFNPQRQELIDTLEIVELEIDISNIYEGLIQGKKHRLRIMVCHGSNHYTCFGHGQQCKHWIFFNDEMTDEVGKWEEVLQICKNRLYFPHILFYEAADGNAKEPDRSIDKPKLGKYSLTDEQS